LKLTARFIVVPSLSSEATCINLVW